MTQKREASHLENTTNSNPQFNISRIFDAPKNIVWKAWTDPDQFSQWFGPKGFKAKNKTFDIRKGGMIHSCLESPEGISMWAKFVFQEVEVPNKLVWEHSFSDENGNITRHPMSPTWPLKMLTTVVFTEIGEKTRIDLNWSLINPTKEEADTFKEGMSGMNQGWTGTFEQLSSFLADR